jgi:hypothetical protein
MTSPIPAAGYPSNTSRTQADMQTYFETMLSITKEQLGGTTEAASVQLASNTFTPGNNACVFPIDTNAGGPTDTLNTIQTTNIRDGEVLFIRSTNNARVITVTNAAGGAGELLTANGNNIELNDTRLFVAFKYNFAITAFEEMFRSYSSPNLSSPGPIGNTTPSSGEFTTLTLTGPVGVHQWLGNNTSSGAAPTFQSLTSGDLPATSVNTVGNLSPLFSADISAQALNFTLSNANAGTLFGNFGSAAASPSYNAPGSADQVLGVATAGGLEYKTIAAGSGITITPTAGTITIAATGGGGFTNPMTTLGDAIYGATSGTATRLAGNTTTTKQFLNQTGTGSVSAAPVWGALASSDIPWASPGAIGSTTPGSGKFTTLAVTGTVAAHTWLGNNTGSFAAPSFESITSADLPTTTVNSAGNLSPLFTTAISAQALNFSLSNAAAGSLLGNASGTSGAPSYIAPGSNDQLLGVVHTGSGLEYKSLVAGANITITPTAGSITIASTGGGGSTTVNLMNQLRVYATSGTPFSNTTYTTASVPVPVSTFYIGGRPDGNQCTFNQGTSYEIFGVSETAFSPSGLTASTRYDLYMKIIGGTGTISTAAWTGTATPPTRGTDTYGRATLNGDTTSLLIGTFLANTATTASLFTSVSDTAYYAGTPAGMLMAWQPPTTTTPIPNGFALCNGATAVWETGPSAGTSFTTRNYIGMTLIGSDMPSGTSTANASGFGTTVPGTVYGATTHAHTASLAASVSVSVFGSGTTSEGNASAGDTTSGSGYATFFHSHTFSVSSSGSGSGTASGTTATASSLPSCIGTVMLVKL